MKRVLIDKARVPTKLQWWNIFTYDMVSGVGRFCAHTKHPRVLQTQTDDEVEPCPGEWKLPTLRHQMSRNHVMGALALTHGWMIKACGGGGHAFEYTFQPLTSDARPVMQIQFDRPHRSILIVDKANGMHPIILPELVRPDASMIARLFAVSHALGDHTFNKKMRTDIWSELESRRKHHGP